MGGGGGYTGFTLSTYLSVCPSICLSFFNLSVDRVSIAYRRTFWLNGFVSWYTHLYSDLLGPLLISILIGQFLALWWPNACLQMELSDFFQTCVWLMVDNVGRLDNLSSFMGTSHLLWNEILFVVDWCSCGNVWCQLAFIGDPRSAAWDQCVVMAGLYRNKNTVKSLI